MGANDRFTTFTTCTPPIQPHPFAVRRHTLPVTVEPEVHLKSLMQRSLPPRLFGGRVQPVGNPLLLLILGPPFFVIEESVGHDLRQDAPILVGEELDVSARCRCIVHDEHPSSRVPSQTIEEVLQTLGEVGKGLGRQDWLAVCGAAQRWRDGTRTLVAKEHVDLSQPLVKRTL